MLDNLLAMPRYAELVMKLSRCALDRYDTQRLHGTVVLCRGGSQEEDAAARSADVVQVCLWSLNPAIAFRDLARGAHSLVLTSGTLAPMDTFASEVGLKKEGKKETI